MASKVVPVRVPDPGEHEEWKKLAKDDGMNFNAWAVRALREAAALQQADERERSAVKRKRQVQVQTAFPQGTCSTAGYCYVHDTRHV